MSNESIHLMLISIIAIVVIIVKLLNSYYMSEIKDLYKIQDNIAEGCKSINITTDKLLELFKVNNKAIRILNSKIEKQQKEIDKLTKESL